MSYANWQALAEAGITSVTRTNWNPRQPQYHLVSRDEPHCRPVPGHETILACPDFYLTEQSAADAPGMIERAINTGGMIDLWAHTEEVVTPAQIAAWRNVVRYAAERRDAGDLWIAPLAEIADRQRAVASVRIEQRESEPAHDMSSNAPLRFLVTNHSIHDLEGLTLNLPSVIRQATLHGEQSNATPVVRGPLLIFDLAAGQTIEVTAWLE